MTTYNICKILIKGGRYTKEDMLSKLDIFLLGSRITLEQYEELVDILESK